MLDNSPQVSLTTPAVSLNINNLLEITAIGTDGKMLHDYQSTTVAGGWGGWRLMPNTPTFSNMQPAAAQNADGRLEIFAVDTNGEIEHIAQSTTSG